MITEETVVPSPGGLGFGERAPSFGVDGWPFPCGRAGGQG